MASYFSSILFHAMDCIGFSRQMILLRSDIANNMYETVSENCAEYLCMEVILAGSKSEGVTQTNASDNDLMLVLRKCICVDTGRQENDFIVLEAITKDCPPGYTQLRLVNDGNMDIPDIFYMASEYDIIKGVLLLKSAGFHKFFTLVSADIPSFDGLEQKYTAINGPAFSMIVERSNYLGIKSAKIYNDHVLAMPYYSFTILTEWKNRVRHYEWPPASLIHDVSTMEGFVVPIGHKLSEEQHFEWRICYTTAERQLITSLNETQLKLYIVIKMVNKNVIKPVLDCVTSYMLKNVILWVTECSPLCIQHSSYLTRFMIQSLWFLLHCLLNNHLPNYMIPSRNLLLGKMKSDQKQTLTRLLGDLINEGDTIVLRCDKLKNAMFILVSNQSLAFAFKVWRDEVEKLILEINRNITIKTRPDMILRSSYIYDMCYEYWKDESYMVNIFRLYSLLNVDIFSLTQNGIQNFQDIVTCLDNLLS
ncbi:uncharacterized protein LOC132734798 [Ruditapes philippinarum]|uniref:uncharacterized protein LOC132734798 n=1 Tax=Ruditapes philippinarum TaxID=129788 RepID=UPI00295AA154|nr:uncharacterized protein LOC132734798 [Ruditapes philippinarum]